MKWKTLALLLGVVVMAAPAMAQQDPNDLGLMDTVRMEIANPTPVGTDLTFEINLYIYNDSTVIGTQIWFQWMSPNLRIDSAVVAQVALDGFDQVILLPGDDVTVANDSQLIQFGAFRIFKPGLTGDAAAAKLVATYYFTYTGWTSSDSVVFDTVSVQGSSLKLTNNVGTGVAYAPYWQRFVYREAAGITVSGGGNTLPADYALEQNYPNPFNPTTVIPFSLPRAGEYTLTIYNVLGQVVEQFTDVAEAPGNYEIQWDAAGQASGVYFYRLQAGSFVETRKMMLLK